MNQPNGTTEFTSEKARLREAPVTRFSGPQHSFDLLELSAHLRNEVHPGVDGHRQMTIFHQGATTIVLFSFEAGGKLADHKANGLVTIHVLDGALTVEAQSEKGWQKHELHAQEILALGPGVLHSVTANEVSRILLTVHLDKGAVAPQ